MASVSPAMAAGCTGVARSAADQWAAHRHAEVLLDDAVHVPLPEEVREDPWVNGPDPFNNGAGMDPRGLGSQHVWSWLATHDFTTSGTISSRHASPRPRCISSCSSWCISSRFCGVYQAPPHGVYVPHPSGVYHPGFPPTGFPYHGLPNAAMGAMSPHAAPVFGSAGWWLAWM